MIIGQAWKKSESILNFSIKVAEIQVRQFIRTVLYYITLVDVSMSQASKSTYPYHDDVLCILGPSKENRTWPSSVQTSRGKRRRDMNRSIVEIRIRSHRLHNGLAHHSIVSIGEITSNLRLRPYDYSQAPMSRILMKSKISLIHSCRQCNVLRDKSRLVILSFD